MLFNQNESVFFFYISNAIFTEGKEIIIHRLFSYYSKYVLFVYDRKGWQTNPQNSDTEVKLVQIHTQGVQVK